MISPLKVPEVISNISITMLRALMKSDKTNNSASTRFAYINITLQPSGVDPGNALNDLRSNELLSKQSFYTIL